MKKIITTTLLLMITFISNLSATTFTFNGIGNWNDSTKWSPYMPVFSPHVNFYQDDTIVINGECLVISADFLTMNQDLTYFINGKLVNNGELYVMGRLNITATGSIINNYKFILSKAAWFADGFSDNKLNNSGLIENNASMELYFRNPNFINNGILRNDSTLYILGNIINNNSIENAGWFETISDFEYFDLDSEMMLTGYINADIINNGLITNSGIINSGSKIENHSKIISNDGYMSGYGRGTAFLNYDTIIGKQHSGSLTNFGFISPGFSEFDTDTLFTGTYGINNLGVINMEINSSTDFDVIEFQYGENLSSISGMNIIFNPNFTPSITDTFTLVYALNAGPSPFKMARNNMTIQAPPVGFIWKVIYETQAMKLTLVPSTALPYENLTFKAIQKANQVELNWNVTSIENTATFEIERANDNNQFIMIGQINGSEKLDYSFIDSKPNVGINQYRLKAIDIDGKYNYSEIIKIDFTTLKNEIINTLVEDNLYINMNAEETIAIFNQTGQGVFNQQIKDGQTKIPLSHLSKGIYFVQTQNATYKILKL